MDLLEISEKGYRFFGNPYQVPVSSYDELYDLIQKNNCNSDCYISIFEVVGGSVNILYYAIDLDSDDPNIVKKDSEKIVEFMFEEDINFLMSDSGRRGNHFWVPLNKGSVNKSNFESMTKILIRNLDLKTLDTHVSTNPKSLLRIPGTMNMKSGKMCEVIMEYEDGDNLNFENYIEFDEKINEEYNDTYVYIHDFPCLDVAISAKNPAHWERTSWAIKEFVKGSSITDIIEIIEKKNWLDWNQCMTINHLRKIQDKKLNLTSCQTLYNRGICLREACPYFSGWC